MSFKTILPSAWELTQDAPYDLFPLSVPIAWQQAAKSLALSRVRLTGKGYPSVPVYSLNSIILACFPQIIKTDPKGWQHSGVPWIFSTEQADLDLFPEFIKDWLREEFSECLGNELVEATLNNLKSLYWQWENKPTTYSLLDKSVCFQALPYYLAEEFLKDPTVFFGAEDQYQLTFYRVVSLNQGAELMSWPPYPVTVAKHQQQVRTADISFVIHFKVQTVPWRTQPIITHQLSIRHWIIEPLEKLPYRGATAYIGDNRRWLDGVRQPFCFMSLSMKQKGKDPKWHRAISELLKVDNRPLPDPHTLASQPAYNWSTFGSRPSGIQAAIAYDARHRGQPPCLKGVSSLDLASLDRAVEARLPVHRVGEAVKVGKVVSFWEPGKPKKRDDKSPKAPNELSTPMLRPKIAAPAVFRQTENPLQTILILWETQDCRGALIAEICQLLSLSSQGETKIYETPNGGQGEETLYQGELGSLWIKTQHVEDLTQKLDIDNSSIPGKNRQQRRVNLLQERIHQITSALPTNEGLSGALVEIKLKTFFFIPESDPKLAWRIGVMQAGYLNQHIHALTGSKKTGEKYRHKNGQQRAKRAVADLLRQFGILPTLLIKSEIDGIEQNLWLTCFYVLRRTRKTTASNTAFTVALMVRVNPLTGIVEMTTPSWFPTQGWVSYPVGLGYLLTEKWDPDSIFEENTVEIEQEQSFSTKKQEQQFLNKFVTDCLRDCINQPIEEEKSPRVLFMAEAQNARKLLTWLRNPDLPANNLPGELKLTESEKERLWVVRLRVANNGEVPVVIIKESSGSRTSGVFQWQDVCEQLENSSDESKHRSLYLSIRKPLTTEQNVLLISQSRLDDGSRQTAIPKPLEIAVVHHPGIDATQLASLVHNLRDRWPYFADYVSLPFPFPFATNAKEYAVSVKDSEESDIEEEEDI